MRAIDRYLLRQCFEATVFVTVALTCAVWLTQSLRYVELIVNRGLALGTFLYLTVLLLPTFLLVILPISLFCALLFVYNKLISDSELVVMRATGVSQFGLARPGLFLAGGVCAACYALSLYFVPASFQQFKDLEFTIRNDYSAILLQEGVFNTLSDGLTVYVRERERSGEMLGVLVHDNRDRERPVSMMAERGALVATPEGPRVLLFKGNRQEMERASGGISILYFDRYTIDLTQFTSGLEDRWRTPEERFLPDLLFPDYDSEADAYYAKKLIAEGNQRIVAPLLSFAFAMVALVGLLSGEFNRRGQTRRILVAIGLVAGVQAAGLGFLNLSAGNLGAVPLMYANVLLPIMAGLVVLLGRRGPFRLARTGT